MDKSTNFKINKDNHYFFLIVLIIISLILVFILFKPFFVEIIIAAVLSSVFYKTYDWLRKILFGKKYLASFLMCFLLLLLVIIPATNLIIYAGKKAPLAFETFTNIMNQSEILQNDFLKKLNIPTINEEEIKKIIIDFTKNISDWLMSGATILIKGTTSFAFSLVAILLTMFFFFADGDKMIKKMVDWSPLPDKYDFEIIKKFKRVSYVTLVSIFVTAFAQGLIGALGFLIIGWPFLFVFIIMAFLSLIPYIGSSIFYIPVAIYLMITGNIWQAIFIIAWCWLVVSNVDELIRAYIIKGRSEVNPIFIIFSIMGGILVFGFWGVVIGPLIIALATTVLHIYEIERKQSKEQI